jgi:hypothetical protein
LTLILSHMTACVLGAALTAVATLPGLLLVSELRDELREIQHRIAPVVSEYEPTGTASGGGTAEALPPSDAKSPQE